MTIIIPTFANHDKVFLTFLRCFILEMKNTTFLDMGLLSVVKKMLQVGYSS